MIFKNGNEGKQGCATPTWEHDVPKSEKPPAAKWNVFTGAKMGHMMPSQGMFKRADKDLF